jgi:hypothetical protein
VQIHRPRHIPLHERLRGWIDAQQLRAAAPNLWWLATLIAGLATLAYALVLQGVFPASGAAMAPGYGTPVIAFEFATNAADLTAIFGTPDDPQRAARLAAMQAGNEQDFLFMLLYAAFLASGCWALWREVRRPVVLLGVVMPVLAACFDAWENTLLFAIQVAFALEEYAPEIKLLAAPVTAKFLLLAATNVLIGYGVMQIPGRAWQLVGVLVIVPCIATVMALIAPIAFAWTLAPVLAAGWLALLGTAAIASWHALARKRPLAAFSDEGLRTLQQRRREDRDEVATAETATPIKPAVFGRRRTDSAQDD